MKYAPKYRDLTPEQKKLLCNGCGGKGSWVPVPDFRFSASCDHHDYNYLLGHTEEDRKKADDQFYKAMRDDAGWNMRHLILAWIYYRAVRWKGKKYFRYGKDYLTMEEFNEKMCNGGLHDHCPC